jgi:acyl carrier protein
MGGYQSGLAEEVSMAIPNSNSLKEILECVLDNEIAELDQDANIYDVLGMDSIGAVAMVVEIQRRFSVRIPDDRIPQLHSVRAILDEVIALKDAQHEESTPADARNQEAASI